MHGIILLTDLFVSGMVGVAEQGNGHGRVSVGGREEVCVWGCVRDGGWMRWERHEINTMLLLCK